MDSKELHLLTNLSQSVQPLNSSLLCLSPSLWILEHRMMRKKKAPEVMKKQKNLILTSLMVTSEVSYPQSHSAVIANVLIDLITIVQETKRRRACLIPSAGQLSAGNSHESMIFLQWNHLEDTLTAMGKCHTLYCNCLVRQTLFI